MDDAVAELYRRFARVEAAGESAIYAEWAEGVARDGELSQLIGALPGIKRQPNLVFAAARFAGAPVGSYEKFRTWLVPRWSVVEPIIRARATQTNEAGRCAVLLAVLGRLQGELALIEAGASAGLVLYPDRYSYRYRVDGRPDVIALDPPSGPSRVVLPCAIDEASLPSRLPTVVWRAGVDLSPIDVTDAGAVRWLETLVWPEHDARRERLREAVAIAAAEKARLIRGHLLDGIPKLIDEAPRGAHVVVFHSAVLNYLPAEERRSFAELMAAHPEVTWISNEGPGVLPEVDAQLSVDPTGSSIVAVNGRAVGLAGPHGQRYRGGVRGRGGCERARL